MNKSQIHQGLFFLLAAASLLPWVSAPIALLAGILLTNFFRSTTAKSKSSLVKRLLQLSIIGLGFGMNINNALEVGKEGLLLTIFTLVFVFLLGWGLSKVFGLDKKIAYLISSGTAICGGSAIAAVAPLIKANEKEISIAIGTVFVLNAVALFVFPVIGHLLELTQHDFGIWSAIAIHDTSSVVGAASQYGEEALEIATTVKLSRALWIIPLSIMTAIIFRQTEKGIKFPYFILLFISAMLISSWLPQFAELFSWISYIAKRLLVLTLFLVGTQLTLDTIKTAGVKSMLFGSILWIAVSIVSLVVILVW
ncbi:MAG: putative sulfate exporter family transporter [Crocinitomicaceae bacterium]|nr:putative sulfate exporter family transporter [Crocinitomicaceae bacterium]